jgi:DnaK suppressor protein
MPLRPDDVERLRQRLLRLRQELLGQGPARIEPSRRDATSVGVADEDEQALVEMLQILASSRNKNQSELLALVERALRKLDGAMANQSYGLCEECDEELPLRRLELMPYAPFCTECQAEVDPARNVARRKVTDYR